MRARAFRIAHMGHLSAAALLGALGGAVELALQAKGVPHGAGASRQQSRASPRRSERPARRGLCVRSKRARRGNLVEASITDARQPRRGRPAHDANCHITLRSKVTSAEGRRALIPCGATLGLSGFTGSGYPRRCARAGGAHRGGACRRPALPRQVDGRLSPGRSRRRAGEGGRHRVPPALQFGPHRPLQDQQRADGLHRHAPVAGGADGLAGLSRPPRHCGDRGHRHRPDGP